MGDRDEYYDKRGSKSKHLALWSFNAGVCMQVSKHRMAIGVMAFVSNVYGWGCFMLRGIAKEGSEVFVACRRGSAIGAADV
jgi:hypothetical protein